MEEVLMDESNKMHSVLTPEEIDHYSNYFIDLKDKKYMEKENKMALDSIKELNKDDLGIGLNEMVHKMTFLLNKYGYYNLYEKVLNVKISK